ncbi:MAG: phosphoribosyltransferase family protein [bacterium]|nr:phosphoribosyltransferase family protein [bacterium]
MRANKIYSTLKKAGAIKEGHFVLRNGHHSDTYVEMEELFKEEKTFHDLMEVLAKRTYRDASDFCFQMHFDFVIGPANGGNIMSDTLAPMIKSLTNRDCRVILTQKVDGGTFDISLGDAIWIKHKVGLLVEDVTTTGRSVLLVDELIHRHGGVPAGCAVIWNRGGVPRNKLGENIPFISSLLTKEPTLFLQEECALCRSKVPVNTDYGAGAEFLASRK